MKQETITDYFFVLTKYAYGESSLIISTLSANYGKQKFFLKGAKKIGKKQFPTVDIFRKIKIEFRESSKDLKTPLNIELCNQFDDLASDSESFKAAGKIIKFIQKNTFPDLEYKLLFTALENILSLLTSKKENPYFCIALIKLIFLFENGLLPQKFHNNKELNKKSKAIINHFIKFSLGEVNTTLSLPKNYLEEFSTWIDSLCQRNNLLI